MQKSLTHLFSYNWTDVMLCSVRNSRARGFRSVLVQLFFKLILSMQCNANQYNTRHCYICTAHVRKTLKVFCQVLNQVLKCTSCASNTKIKYVKNC